MSEVFGSAWVVWGIMFVAIEGAALFNKQKGDTLSEFVWKFLGVKGHPLPSGYKWRRGALAVSFAWLVLHFFTGKV